MKPARDRFLDLLRAAVEQGSLAKLTLGKYRGAEASLRNLFVRPVALKAGERLSFLWRHATSDVTKNHPPAEALALLGPLIGGDFLDAHLFTAELTAQLECQPDGSARLRTIRRASAGGPKPHDRAKARLIVPDAPWLEALGITNPEGKPREGMAAKFRQIEKFAEILSHLAGDAGLEDGFRLVDMGSGKGYLTFAAASLFPWARVTGVELRPALVDLGNRIAREQGFAPRLEFVRGQIADAPLEGADAVVALHACDTATDDALARGIGAQASLLVVAPCCQKELRGQLTAPEVLRGALRHGIFQERQAEFATDALRAELLEWAGYRTKVFEFVSTEHTPKNLLIAGVRSGPAQDPDQAAAVRALAAFYGVTRHHLAGRLGFSLKA